MLHSAALIIFYMFFFSAPYFFERYFQPLRIVWLLLLVCFIPEMTRLYRDFRKRKPLIAKTGLILILTFTAGFSIIQYAYHFLIPAPFNLYQTAEWAHAHSSETVGMGQSGITGYFCDNVVNLDGKVNPAALSAIRGSGIGEYIAKNNIAYVADWPGISEPIVRSAHEHGVEFTKIDSIGPVLIFQRNR